MDKLDESLLAAIEKQAIEASDRLGCDASEAKVVINAALLARIVKELRAKA